MPACWRCSPHRRGPVRPTTSRCLQTAASIENLAVATYGVALTLDFIGGASANPVVKAFSTKTMMQHQEHADAFNAAHNLHGQTQSPTLSAHQKISRRMED